jgi:hypothetical protein
MGTGPQAVIDARMRVQGVEPARGRAAMPDLVSAHLDPAVLTMAEKAVDLVAGVLPTQLRWDSALMCPEAESGAAVRRVR